MGLMRVKVRAEKDEKEGYVTVAGNQGTVFLEPYTAYAALQKSPELRVLSRRRPSLLVPSSLVYIT